MRYFFFVLFVAIFIFPGMGRSQEGFYPYFIDASSFIYNAPMPNVSTPSPTLGTKNLPLEWRGLWISVDSQNFFRNRFSQISYGLSSSAIIGFKQYNLRFETIAPLSAQGWQYRVRLEYQIF